MLDSDSTVFLLVRNLGSLHCFGNKQCIKSLCSRMMLSLNRALNQYLFSMLLFLKCGKLVFLNCSTSLIRCIL